ncbi:hypothetical protein J1605_013021 [Eschrichtius robustus]|uniref:C2H2-type domain-containing protein n=1 Tax=Eschrichtius robustus TaxID=9764 RepID=A0AB34GKC2_ESCRO|nr:hypothetical protein J1605_013021 [Eschrichtius robustus]
MSSPELGPVDLMGLSTCSAEMTDPFCVGGGRRLPGSSKSGPGKDGGRNEVRLPMLHDPPKLGLPVVRGGQTAPSQAPLCFDPGSPASDRTEGKKKGRPKAENQALRDIPVSSPRAGWGSCRVCGGAHCLARPACCVSSAEPSARIHWLLRVRGLRETAWGPAGPVRGSCRPGDSAESGAGQQRPGWLQGQQPGLSHAQLSLMNQWKDEFKAHSRVKCPNAGCWLEFPSIYGLKYHYQRCQGVRGCGLGKGRPGAHPALAVGLGVSTPALSTQGAISERLTFPCPFCEAAFTSKTQLEKHRIWNHMDRPLPAPKPGPVSRPVTVSRPVGVSKPIGVSKPVTISKPIGISKPVTVSRPVPVTKPVTVSRPVPVTKPVMASRPVPVTKAVPVTRPVPVNKPIPVTKSVPIAKPVTVNKPVPVTKPVTINKPVSVTKLVTVTKPVPVAKPVTVSRPIVVSKPVTVSRPIAISRHTPPCKMVLLTKSENKAPRAAGRSSGKKRAADGLDACPLPPKQARPENGEYGPSTTDQSSAFPLSTDPSSSPLSLGSRPLGGKEAPRAAGPVSLPEEGAERTKHSKTRAGGGGRAGAAASRPEPPDGYLTRAFVLCFLSPESGRKQKTPKKFTGEQPSISGTFGLKGEAWTSRAPVGPSTRGGRALSLHLPLPRVHVGLAKAEDKARIHRAKKQEGPVPEEARKKGPAPTSAVSKEVPAPVAHPAPGGPEEQWQRAIHERGEAVCPTCNVVTRKTLVGLKKHMEVCQKVRLPPVPGRGGGPGPAAHKRARLQLQDALKCQHCRKQFKSKAGLNYHTMAEHSAKPSDAEASEGSEQERRERLRKVLKQMGRLRCPQEVSGPAGAGARRDGARRAPATHLPPAPQGCGAAFSSLMGYQYHQRRCGKPPCEVETPSFPCTHCGKTYRSKAGHDYHVRSEHAAPPPEEPADKAPEAEDLLGVERTPSGRIRRTSAQVAVFHLQEIAEDELARDWTKRRMKDDLVPETARLNYTRPGLPVLNPQLLEEWKNEVKEKGHVNCPNDCCEAVYSSVSGLKAHLAGCSKVSVQALPAARRACLVLPAAPQRSAHTGCAPLPLWGQGQRSPGRSPPPALAVSHSVSGGSACGGCSSVPGQPDLGLGASGGGQPPGAGLPCAFQGDHLVGKYCCLLCPKEFSSESGVKYHILKAHAENWFRTSADPPPRHKGPDSLVPRKEKSPAGGKKRGRKPKERPPEDPAPGTPPHRDDWPPGGRDKGARGSAGRKVGAGKAPEK